MKLAGEWLVKDYSRKGYFAHTHIASRSIPSAGR